MDTAWEFAAKGGGALFFAGVWQDFEDPMLGPSQNFAIITEPASSPLNGYIDRAPVVLWGPDRATWLDPDASSAELESVSSTHHSSRPLSSQAQRSWKNAVRSGLSWRGTRSATKPTPAPVNFRRSHRNR
ncbi:MAG: SOS response-associated peptidase family protein [Alphaproteobacteria bacterium]|nr:SOS response-associated peptidase family protein [Alphaproteobacteria bacterium]